jgi:hypothetical protein
MFGVHFRRVVVMVGGVQRMAVRDFRVMRRLFVMPRLMVLRRFLVVMRGFLVMLVDVVIHDSSPRLGWPTIASHRETFATCILQKRNNGGRALAFY